MSAPEIALSNLIAAATAEIAVQCPRCTVEFEASVARIQRDAGRSLCPRCHRTVHPPTLVDIHDHSKETNPYAR